MDVLVVQQRGSKCLPLPYQMFFTMATNIEISTMSLRCKTPVPGVGNGVIDDVDVDTVPGVGDGVVDDVHHWREADG